jgi:hypothetical protein
MGEEPADDAWVLDWSDWAGAYEIWLRRRQQYQDLIRNLTSQTTLSEVMKWAARRDPLALLDAQEHPGRINVAEAEIARFTHPQTGGVSGGEEDAVLEICHGIKKADNFLRRQDDRQTAGAPRKRDGLGQAPVTFESDLVEKAQGANSLVEERPRNAPLDKVNLISADFSGSEQVR